VKARQQWLTRLDARLARLEAAAPAEMAPVYATVGSVDEDEVLWNTQEEPGTFTTTARAGWDTCYLMIKGACSVFDSSPCVGDRPTLSTTEGDGQTRLGPYSYLTYREYFARVEAVGSGLAAHLQRGDTAMIYADTSLPWMLSAFGCWRCGVRVATCYATLGEEAVLFAINQSQAKLVLADAKLLRALANLAGALTTVEAVVALTDEAATSAPAAKLRRSGIRVHNLSELEAAGAAAPTPPTPGAPSDVAMVMYTSGTTGEPKGVLMSHANIMAVAASMGHPASPVAPYIGSGKRFLAYLPLAHIMELVVEMGAFSVGATIGYSSPGTLLKQRFGAVGDAESFRPTFFLAAPAVLDRLVNVVNGKVDELPFPLKAWFNAALASGAANYERGGIGASNPLLALIFKPVQKLLGGAVEIMATGSAPLSAEAAKFCSSVFNCPIVQGYGLTETAGASCLAYPCHEHSVGPPLPCACIRLRDWEEGCYRSCDRLEPSIGMRRGEVLIGGPGVAMGYLVDPAFGDAEVEQKNCEEFTEIGGVRYFCTGDIGQITHAGTLQIIDRKKDLVKLSFGEYVALSKVENALKSSRFVAVPAIVAESTMNYCIALICPTPAVRELASEAGLAASATWEEVCASPVVAEAVLADVKAVVKGKLATFEVPRKCVLIDDEFSVENEMMTAVRKLKRKPIAAKYAEQIAAIYK